MRLYLMQRRLIKMEMYDDSSNFPIREGETDDEYTLRICNLKSEGYTWSHIAHIVNSNLGTSFSEDRYRKFAKNRATNLLFDSVDGFADIVDSKDTDFAQKEKMLKDLIFEIKKERVKLSDERVQNNAHIRRLAREETISELGVKAAQVVANVYPYVPEIEFSKDYDTCDEEATLILSDWHYGIDVNNAWNSYNTTVAKERISKVVSNALYKCSTRNVKIVNIVNLGDLICGRIHTQLRIESRIDTLTQIMDVSEIMAQVLMKFENHGYEVRYYDCSDNHSRIEPDKKNSIDLESLTRIVRWYLTERFRESENIHICTPTIDDDFVVFRNSLGQTIGGVHGDKDTASKVVQNMSLMMRTPFDMILTAHMHHFSADEKNEVVVVSNGSLMGTDTYAKNLRLSGTPSQTLVISTKSNVCDTIFKLNA